MADSLSADCADIQLASVIFVGIMGISGVLYAVRGRKTYAGPVVRVEGRAEF